MTKESLREKFWKDCKDKKLEPMSECEQIDMMWDFFWNEMQKEKEGLEEKIKELPNASRNEVQMEKVICEYDLLALIKQENDNRE